MIKWISCGNCYHTVDLKFVIKYEAGSYTLIMNNPAGQRVFACKSVEDAKKKAEELFSAF